MAARSINAVHTYAHEEGEDDDHKDNVWRVNHGARWKNTSKERVIDMIFIQFYYLSLFIYFLVKWKAKGNKLYVVRTCIKQAGKATDKLNG